MIVESVPHAMDKKLNLDGIPMLRVLNKVDLVQGDTIPGLCKTHDGTPISANNRATLSPLIEKMQAMVETVPVSGY